jgi:hypothetical protein
MELAHLLDVSEKIYDGIKDHNTLNWQFDPLWRHPILLETLLHMLRSNDDVYQDSFKTVCGLICPEFLSVMDDRT